MNSNDTEIELNIILFTSWLLYQSLQNLVFSFTNARNFCQKT
jgi:hypothetical protein